MILFPTTQVSENGALSFGIAYEDPPVTVGSSLLPSDAGDTLLVAPFWTDYNYDLNAGGRVKYETYDMSNSGRIERMRQVTEFIVNRTTGLEEFDASWMILVEWRDRVPRDPSMVSARYCMMAMRAL